MSEAKLTTSVFVTEPSVLKNEILLAAIREVKDNLPPAANVKAVIASTERKTVNGESGREYIVDVFYTKRGKTEDEVSIDTQLEALETPVFNPGDLDEYA